MLALRRHGAAPLSTATLVFTAAPCTCAFAFTTFAFPKLGKTESSTQVSPASVRTSHISSVTPGVGRAAVVPGGERGRKRAGHLQGSGDHAPRPPQAHRGLPHRGRRHARPRRLHLHPVRTSQAVLVHGQTVAALWSAPLVPDLGRHLQPYYPRSARINSQAALLRRDTVEAPPEHPAKPAPRSLETTRS